RLRPTGGRARLRPQGQRRDRRPPADLTPRRQGAPRIRLQRRRDVVQRRRGSPAGRGARVRLLLVSEGALDVGTAEQGEGPRGAVSVLVRRLLSERFGREIQDWEIERDVLPRVHARSETVSGYPRKVLLAIEEAKVRGCSSVAVVVDRDRTEGGSRLAQLRE